MSRLVSKLANPRAQCTVPPVSIDARAALSVLPPQQGCRSRCCREGIGPSSLTPNLNLAISVAALELLVPVR
jgi:hypothetical protein